MPRRAPRQISRSEIQARRRRRQRLIEKERGGEEPGRTRSRLERIENNEDNSDISYLRNIGD